MYWSALFTNLQNQEYSMIKLGTVFSGIGSIEQALKRLGKEHQNVFACDNGDVELCLFNKSLQKEYSLLKTKVGKRTISETEILRLRELEHMEAALVEDMRNTIFNLSTFEEKKKFVDNLYSANSRKTNYVQKTYLANYDINSNSFFQDIRFLDGRDFKHEIDLLVGGSPCQSFSSVGAQRGLEDVRGTLFYEFARLIKDIQPKVFIYENVRGLTTHDNGQTWEIIKSIFQNELGYYISEPQVLNASDFGIPQTRRRLFVVGFKDQKYSSRFCYPTKQELRYTMQDFLEDNCSYGNFNYSSDGSISIVQSKGYPNKKFYLTPKVRDYVLCSGTKSFKTSTATDLPIARTILKTMTQHHRAGVDNYITVDGDGDSRTLRSLTDREALRLMGYDDNFKIVVSHAQIFRQAGNSIVVDVMLALLKQIYKTQVFE